MARENQIATKKKKKSESQWMVKLVLFAINNIITINKQNADDCFYTIKFISTLHGIVVMIYAYTHGLQTNDLHLLSHLISFCKFAKRLSFTLCNFDT